MISRAVVFIAGVCLTACSQMGTQGQSSAQDAKYAKDIAQANLAEIATGQLAMQKAASPAVRRYGEHMVQEHTALQQQTAALASAKGMEPPKSPDLKHEAAAKMLQMHSGEGFDRAYMEQMVKDHEQTLALLQETAQNASDADLRAQAQQAIPHVREHLEMARRMTSSTTGSSR